MLPDLPVLVAIVLGLLAFQPGPASPIQDALGTAACVVVTLALIWMNGRRAGSALRESRAQAVKASARWMTVLPLLGWLACLYVFGWGHLVDEHVPHVLWLGRYVIFFLPAVVLFGASWASQAELEKELVRARGGVPAAGSAWSAIKQGLRRNGIALVPLFVMLGLIEGLWILGDLGVPGLKTFSRWLDAVPLASVAFMLAILSVLSLALPLLLARLFSTEDLPPGRTRDVLERQARMLNLRYGRLLLWKTKGRILNAMVVGFTPRTRTIFLTDALLQNLPEDEVLAVFCHEAGHAKRHHLPLFLVLFIASAILFQISADALVALGVPDFVIMLGHLAFIWFVLFGFVSRLFERDADLYGAEHAADLAPAAAGLAVPGLDAPIPEGTTRMMRALKRVGMVSGRTASHRHGSIEDRVRYLAAYATESGVRRDFARQKRTLLLAIASMVLLAGLAAALRLPRDIAYGRQQLAMQDGLDAFGEALDLRAAGDAGEAARWKAAHDAFTSVREGLTGDEEPRAKLLRLHATFQAGDSAFHGLGDVSRGQAAFDTVVAEAQAADLPSDAVAPLLFQAHVDLGRMRVWSGDLPGAHQHLQKARALRQDAQGDDGTYDWARLRLLGAVIAGAEGRVDEARSLLEREVLGAAEALGDGVQGDELRADVRLELERLGFPAPGSAEPAPAAPPAERTAQPSPQPGEPALQPGG